MNRGFRRPLSLAAVALLSATSSAAFAQEVAQAPPAGTTGTPVATAALPEVKLDLVVGEVKMLALDATKAWSVLPEGGISARAVDDGHTLRVVALKDGAYTLRLERNDGTVSTYAVHVGASPATSASQPVALALPPEGAAPGVSGQSADAKYTRDTIDLNLEGGIGRHLGDPNTTLGFGRARAGVMFARWPVFTMIGATYEFNNLSPVTLGVQAELLQLSAGVWAQVGGMLDTHGKAGGMLAFGISVIGVEAQYRGYEDSSYGVTLIGKLRIPIGVILYAIDLNKNKKKD